jgi:hypothetical protein
MMKGTRAGLIDTTIIATCQQIHAEATEIFYARNFFSFRLLSERLEALSRAPKVSL